MKRDLVWLASFALLLASCDQKSEIKVYRVSKAPLEDSGPEQQNAMPTNGPSPSLSGEMAAPVSSNSVSTPPKWQPQPLSEMRQASFLVKGEHGTAADISLVSLGQAAANVLENVNRWLNQLDQPPINEQKLNEITQQLTTSIGPVTIVDLTGLPKKGDPAKDGRIIAGIAPTNSATLFFKIRGNSELTEEQKPDFIKWVAAVCNAQTENKSPEMAAMPESSAPPQIKWQTPKDWTQVPPSTMRYATFSTAGENGGKIDISVVTFPGDGGSDVDNINRWRRQIGLAPADENAVTSEINPLKTEETDFSTTDIAGPENRTVAAWTRRDGRVWFFKMTGSNAAVGKEKPKFFDFVRSIQFSS